MNFKSFFTYVLVVLLLLSATGLYAQDEATDSMPNPDYMSEEEFIDAYLLWLETHPEESEETLNDIDLNYVSPIEYLPWQVVDPLPGQDAFSIHQLAQHYPIYVRMPNVNNAIDSHKKAKEEWKKNYPVEFVKFNNYMLQVVGSDRLPRFMSYPVTFEEPLIGDAGNMNKTQMIYELRLMNWNYTYHNETFIKLYEAEATVPSEFDIEEHKTKMMAIVPEDYDKKVIFEEEGMDMVLPSIDNK